MRPQQGLSLLETLMAIFILALTLWSVQFLYAGLLRGTGLSDARRAALASAESLESIWKEKATEVWPEEKELEDEAYSVEGVYGEYIYRVDVSPRFHNPVYEKDTPGSPELLEIRKLTVTLFYEDSNQEKRVRLVGSVSR